ncbi:MAG: hypothetical protein AAGA34_07575 [Pseudomonadota bacterium]
MMMTASRLRQIGWGVVLALCVAAFAVLSLTVHAVRSEVLVADSKIERLEEQKRRLETEFQARASQHQLAQWNRVDLGFIAPRADQYMDNRTQLAKLGQPAGMDAPTQIRVARLDRSGGGASRGRDMVSPITGKPITLAAMDAPDSANGLLANAFGDFLIAASPIRPAKAQTGATHLVAEATE